MTSSTTASSVRALASAMRSPCWPVASARRRASVISVSTSGNPWAFVLAGPGPAPLEDAAAGLCDSRRGRVLFSFVSRRIVVL